MLISEADKTLKKIKKYMKKTCKLILLLRVSRIIWNFQSSEFKGNLNKNVKVVSMEVLEKILFDKCLIISGKSL